MATNSSSSLMTQLLKAASGSYTQPGQTAKLPRVDGLASVSLAGPKQSTGINFGKPPRSTEPKQSAGSNGISTFLQGVASGGISGGLQSVSGILGFGGITSLFSGLESLFGGGKKSTPVLTAFALPDADNESLTIGSVGRGSQTGSTYVQAPDPQSGPAVTDHSQEIAQAVKTALLYSHSLADVINEL